MSVLKPVDGLSVRGVAVAYARLRDVDDEQGIVICDLLDEGDRVLAADRYFHLDKAPFEIIPEDRAALGLLPQPPKHDPGLSPAPSTKGMPDDSWRKDDLIAWLEAQEIPYSRKDSKAALLEKISRAEEMRRKGERENG